VSVEVVELSPEALRERMGEALGVYVAAMDYPPGTEAHRAPMWAEHALRPGWAAVAAIDAGTLVGIGYGYRSARGQWWSEEVRTGLLALGRPVEEMEQVLADTFELTELHVHPAAQGDGLGARLLVALLQDRSEGRVLLSTPEVAEEGNRAWRLYRRTGFGDVLRHFRFTGDPRPFAVLGRSLPLG
jgi:ribosomal protein S18 acetylase RimI-like enzyme